ncbi:peroxisomal membrane anchor protein conserved region-domain-containing protein [Astrocystis sublimbata]|nr:peroxisomal membrane anchor protein conserved region-domain-containing protein [Astrocystis sublimbata]
MAIREDVVSSAVAFLQDPNVVSSSLESKLSFFRSKNLTQEEIDAAFARTGGPPPPTPVTSQTVAAPAQQQPYYPQQPPYGWREPPPEPPKRDWRDWFIMATVVGGVSYGLYFISKRYLYPLVAPPTPERLDQDKASVDEQFEKAFATLEQLAKDTETLKASEAARTEKLDKVLEDLEQFVKDSKSASRRQEDETERLREDIKTINATIPRSMTAHKEFTDGRLKEISTEVKSLKSLIWQRMNPTPQAQAPSPAAPSATPYNGGVSASLRPTSTNATAVSPVPTPSTETKENGSLNGGSSAQNEASPNTSTATAASSKQDYMSSLGGRSSPFGTGAPAAKASIPAWQMAATSSKTPETAASGSSVSGSGS